MHRLPVKSSAVESVGYDARARMLEIEYAGGAVYRYLRVPPRAYACLLRADSIGAFVNRRIKPYHPCVLLEPRRRRERPAGAGRRHRTGGT
jgi:KTSC domain